VFFVSFVVKSFFLSFRDRTPVSLTAGRLGVNGRFDRSHKGRTANACRVTLGRHAAKGRLAMTVMRMERLAMTVARMERLAMTVARMERLAMMMARTERRAMT
jgi:hypothetical protein